MNRIIFLLATCCLLILIQKATCQLNDQYKLYIISLINDKKKLVNPPAANMKKAFWSEALANKALSLAEECSEEVTPIPGVHISHSTALGAPAFQVLLKPFLDQEVKYDPMTKLCRPGMECTDFKQMIYFDNLQMGCGLKVCDKLKNKPSSAQTSVMYCLYIKPEVKGEVAYETGPSCSKCPPDFKCEERLCVPNTPFPEPTFLINNTKAAPSNTTTPDTSSNGNSDKPADPPQNDPTTTTEKPSTTTVASTTSKQVTVVETTEKPDDSNSNGTKNESSTTTESLKTDIKSPENNSSEKPSTTTVASTTGKQGTETDTKRTEKPDSTDTITTMKPKNDDSDSKEVNDKKSTTTTESSKKETSVKPNDTDSTTTEKDEYNSVFDFSGNTTLRPQMISTTTQYSGVPDERSHKHPNSTNKPMAPEYESTTTSLPSDQEIIREAEERAKMCCHK